MIKKALITGITGQDGSYLAEFLLNKNYKIFGLYRRSSTNTFERINHLLCNDHLELIEGDITDATGVNRIIAKVKPDECYNLAAQSHVGTSFCEPVATFNVDALGPTNFLEAIKQNSPETRFYQASTSELYGNANVSPQDENTPFRPSSPYAIAKLAAHHMVRLYREAYGMYACAGILFNHESERRGENFITRKVTKYVAKLYFFIESGFDQKFDPGKLKLGNLNAKRDWGYAPEYCEAMWLMLQQDEPDDFVIATGETHSIRELLDVAFGCININDWDKYVEIDSRFNRPADVHLLCGNPTKAKEKLGWESKVKFHDLITIMYSGDVFNICHNIKENNAV